MSFTNWNTKMYTARIQFFWFLWTFQKLSFLQHHIKENMLSACRRFDNMNIVKFRQRLTFKLYIKANWIDNLAESYENGSFCRHLPIILFLMNSSCICSCFGDNYKKICNIIVCHFKWRTMSSTKLLNYNGQTVE